MAEKFYTLLTDVGKAQIANSSVLGSEVNFVKLKVGDGNGSYYNPTESQTDLVHSVWEGDITQIGVDEDNPNWIVIEVMLPANVGGFTVREYGAFDSSGNMLAISKCAETYKPIIDDGSTKELLLRMILVVSNTENINLKIDPTIIFAKKSEIETVQTQVNTIITKLSDTIYQTATGTATAITLTMQTLVHGYSKTFIASANNAGAATTINGKPLYKPNTTIAPNLIIGKAYTVWYNAGLNCFFIKASAEGDADISQVLATKKFSTDNDTGLVGTMPNNGALNKALSINGTYTIPAGYTSGGSVTQSIPTKAAATITPGVTAQTIAANQYLLGDQVIAGDANLVAANILKGKSIFNISGSALEARYGDYKYTKATSWAYTGATLPANFSSAMCCTYGTKVYCMDGNTLLIFDPTTNTWSTGANIPTFVDLATVQVYNGYIYITGGLSVSLVTMRILQIYNISSNTWSTGTSMGYARSAPASCVNNGYIYVMGGSNDGGTSSSYMGIVEIYNISSNTWSTGTGMYYACFGATAQVYGSNIYVIGGLRSSASAIVQIYNISSNTWSTGTSMGYARMKMTSQLYGDKIFVLGGGTADNSGSYLSCAEVYDISDGTWTIISSIPNPMYKLGSGIYNNLIFCIGGINANGYATTVYILEII